MLSVLIPVYNWDVTSLVQAIHQQCLVEKISFEIIVLDDCSSNSSIQNVNKKIASLQFVNYIQLIENVGNAEARNLLASHSNYNWLLFLDADVLPTNDNFVQKYWRNKQAQKVYSGGLLYSELPSKKVTLRWKFGKKFEELNVDERSKSPYLHLRGCNFLIEKSTFLTHPFKTLNASYGFVDTNFALNLKKAKIPVEHIENPVYHLGLEENLVFVKKYEKASQNAFWMLKNNPAIAQQLRLIKVYKKLKKWYLVPFLHLLFVVFKSLILSNLKSKNPSLFLFQLYKLGYICSLKSE